MRKRWALLCTLFWVALAGPPARAHDVPLSYVDLRTSAAGIEATIEAHAVDLAHDLPAVAPNDLLTPDGADAQKERLAAILASRLAITADGDRLRAELRGIEPLPDQKYVRLRLRFAWKGPPDALRIRCRLFPYDPRHKTFLDIYRGGTLARQAIFAGNAVDLAYRSGSRQDTGAVVRQFLVEGVHHIFVGPDHILFIIGLLLLGGALRQLLKIVTAFTVAHSITLALATLNLFNPPARFIEPAIALSIVFVGVHSLVTGAEKRDRRLLFAFGFGLVHGFGFANVLRELDLPRHALAGSLFSFNLGVELGQACIVLTVAPLLALLGRWSAPVARRVVAAGSLCVIFAGAYWFVQRLFASG